MSHIIMEDLVLVVDVMVRRDLVAGLESEVRYLL